MALVRIKNRAGGRGAKLRRTGTAAAMVSLALLAASCHGPGGGQASGGGQHITVAAVQGLDTASLTVGQQRGVFSSHDLRVTVKDYPSPAAAYAALKSGNAQVAAGDYTEFFGQVVQSRVKLQLIADGYDATTGSMELMTLPGSRISSPQQLSGRVVATPQQDNPNAQVNTSHPYNVESLAAASVLQSDGLSPSTVKWRPLPAGSIIQALRTHDVAAILVTEPLIVQAESQLGAAELLDSCSGLTANLPLTGYFSTTRYASQNATALRAFQAALDEAQGDAASRRTVQRDLTGMSAQDAAMVTMGQYPTFLNVGQVQRVADLMFDSGMIIKQISVKNLVFH